MPDCISSVSSLLDGMGEAIARHKAVWERQAWSSKDWRAECERTYARFRRMLDELENSARWESWPIVELSDVRSVLIQGDTVTFKAFCKGSDRFALSSGSGTFILPLKHGPVVVRGCITSYDHEAQTGGWLVDVGVKAVGVLVYGADARDYAEE